MTWTGLSIVLRRSPGKGRRERLGARNVLCKHLPMASSGAATGTVRLWMADDGWGVIDLPDQPRGCWADASVVEGLDGSNALRAGQTVDVQWTTPGPEDYNTRALRVVLRDELQATPGG